MKNVRGNYGERSSLEWSTMGLHKKIISLINPASKKILDLGSGTGNLGQLLLKEGGEEVTCLDIENFLKFKGLIFKKTDLDKDWPIKSNYFDLITGTEIIEHLENPREFIRKIKLALKIRGTAVISTPNILNWKARIYYLIKGIVWGFREKDYLISGHITPLTKYDFKRICFEEGLKIKKITYDNSTLEFFGNNLIVIFEKV